MDRLEAEMGMHLMERGPSGIVPTSFGEILYCHARLIREVFDMLDGLRQQVLFRDNRCVIARPGHPLFEVENLTWDDLVKHPWISPTSRRSHSVLEYVMKTLNVAAPQQVTVCGSLSHIQ